MTKSLDKLPPVRAGKWDARALWFPDALANPRGSVFRLATYLQDTRSSINDYSIRVIKTPSCSEDAALVAGQKQQQQCKKNNNYTTTTALSQVHT